MKILKKNYKLKQKRRRELTIHQKGTKNGPSQNVLILQLNSEISDSFENWVKINTVCIQ